jgi:dTDP-4-dehydrorhamnose reductase
MTVLIFGANGQVGQALGAILEDAVLLSRAEADFSKPQSLPAVVAEIDPEIIINAAAYTQVDKAEEEEALATCVNGDSTGVLARVAAERGIPFVHYSTDYVFDGSGDAPRRESAPTAPLNAYGRSKLAGERAVQAAGGAYLIFRTSWVYDAFGKNFLNTMLRLGKEREVLRVVADQFGAPSYAPHLAEATVEALDEAMKEKAFPSGLYHLVNDGETSWHGFAEEIFSEARAHGRELKVQQVEPIPSGAYPTPATRPLNSRLDCSKLAETFGLRLPDWREGLREAMEILAS